MRTTQPVEITTDMYGRNVVFHGKLAGISAGTGSVFSILPPQNATGNWIKIVQRVPVRISVDDEDIKRNPLLLGLSVRVTVKIADQSGSAITSAKEPRELYKTDIYESDATGADELIKEIVRENLAEKTSVRR
jgi:membrane fusion protein (multidrug efflux system)